MAKSRAVSKIQKTKNLCDRCSQEGKCTFGECHARTGLKPDVAAIPINIGKDIRAKHCLKPFSKPLYL